MSAESRNDQDRKGYETTDAQAGGTYRAGAYILAAMFAVSALLVPLYWFFARGETAGQPRATSLVRPDPAAAPSAFPRLVTSEPKTLADFRAKEQELLEGWGWVEKDRGVVRMPVAQALELVGSRGELPSFPSPSPAAIAGAPAGPGAGR